MAAAPSVTLTADMGAVQVPKSYNQAKRSPQWSYWKDAIAKGAVALAAFPRARLLDEVSSVVSSSPWDQAKVQKLLAGPGSTGKWHAHWSMPGVRGQTKLTRAQASQST